MNFLSALPIVGDIYKSIFGSKEKRDQYDANAFSTVHNQFASEFRENKNWFDSLIDGLNRLPRPVFAFGTIYLFYMCWNDPDQFIAGAKNLELMPQEAWWILGTIVVFFFGGRLHRDFGKYKIRKEVLQKYQQPSEPLKTRNRHIDENEPDPQDGIDWNDRVVSRYEYND